MHHLTANFLRGWHLIRSFPVLSVVWLGVAKLAAGAAMVTNLTAEQWQAVDADIARYRQGTLVIQTRPGAEVSVRQLRHEFWFGAALANSAFEGRMNPADRERYLGLFLTNFNAAVTENALKWHNMEPRRGQVNYRTVEAILAWTDQHQIPLRGHNIYWGIPNFVPAWQKELPAEELMEVVRQRGLDVGKRYRGRFAEYDLNNEMLHGNFYAQKLGPDITLKMTQWVREGDPQAVFYLNDYDILTGRRVKDYVEHIRGLLAQGVPLGGIGVQGHSHGDTFDRQALRDALDQLAQFKLPIRVTEFNMPGQNSRFYKDRSLRPTDEDEQQKARELRDYYRICFSHPAVAGILMWGFWEGANWIPASSLYRRDWTPLPAAKAYQDLVFKEWWTQWTGRADAQGRCEVPAFFGRHEVTAAGQKMVVELKKAEGKKSVAVGL